VHFVSLFGTGASGRHLAAEFLGPPWETHERYWRTSPLAYVGHMRAPLLLLSGDDDRHCPPAQAEELFAALALRQRDVEWVSFASAAHDFDRSGPPRARLERLHQMLDWLRRKL
jgi:dipeptidyl aminopeptidase/acylaminoacyl peptidase